MYTRHRQHPGEDITNWTDDIGQISWHDSPLITVNTIERTTPTIDTSDTSNDYSLHTPPSDDGTFTDFNDPYTPTNGEHERPPPPPQPMPKAAAVIHHPHPPSPCQLDISTFATQNTHGLCRLPRDTDGKLITTEPYDYTRYEHLITMMKTKSLDVYFVQETWLEGDAFDEVINGYHVFRHNSGKDNHNFRGVAIILSPRYHKGWKDAGARPLLTTDVNSEFAG